MRQLASGQHQSIQSDTGDTLTHEVLRHVMKKVDWMVKNGKDCFLTDSELFVEIQAMGLSKRPELQKSRRALPSEGKRSKKEKTDEQLEVMPIN